MAGIDGFEALYQSSYSRIVREVSGLVGNLPDTEEVVQEAFARALRRWPQLRGYDAPEAWVRRVAFNLALTGRLRARRQQAALARHGLPGDMPHPGVDGIALEQVLRTLPLGYRQVLVLHYVAGLPLDEVAAELELPLGTVKSRLARARVSLATRLSS
jgi:RNA polymerase sigma-70 factor (ECF subfamily)